MQHNVTEDLYTIELLIIAARNSGCGICIYGGVNATGPFQLEVIGSNGDTVALWEFDTGGCDAYRRVLREFALDRALA